MKPAEILSRRKICSKVRMTEVVPAPEEPVTAMIGCLADMARPLERWNGEQAACAEQRRIDLKIVVIAVVALDALHLLACAEYEADSLVQVLRRDIQHRRQ